jgi:hypothetical protein
MKLDLSAYRPQLRGLLSAGWVDAVGNGQIGVGHDVATTAGDESNPSALTVTEKVGREFTQRLCLRWKDASYKRRLALIELVIDDLRAADRRPRCLAVDATSEKSFAGMLRDQLAGRCAVEFFVASKNYEHGRQQMLGKTLMGDLYCQAFEDGVMRLPPGDWIYADHTLVKRLKGSYVYEEDSAGNHADAFVSGGLSLWSLMSKSSRAEIMAAGPSCGPPDPAIAMIPKLPQLPF